MDSSNITVLSRYFNICKQPEYPVQCISTQSALKTTVQDQNLQPPKFCYTYKGYKRNNMGLIQDAIYRTAKPYVVFDAGYVMPEHRFCNVYTCVFLPWESMSYVSHLLYLYFKWP